MSDEKDETPTGWTVDDIALDGLIKLIESTITRLAISQEEFAERAGLSSTRLRDLLIRRVPLSRRDKKASLGLALGIGPEGVDQYLAGFTMFDAPPRPVDTLALNLAIDEVVRSVEALRRVAGGLPPTAPSESSPDAQPPEEGP